MHLIEIRRHTHRVRVLNKQCRYGSATTKRFLVTGEDRTDPRLVQYPNIGVLNIETLDHCFVPVINCAVVVKCTASFMQPGAGNCRNTKRRVHVGSPVALSGKSVTQTKKTARRFAH